MWHTKPKPISNRRALLETIYFTTGNQASPRTVFIVDAACGFAIIKIEISEIE